MSEQSSPVRYEPRDVRFGWIVALIALACIIASAHYYAVLKFYGWQERAWQSQRSSPYPLVSQPSSQLPRQPRLEQIDRLENIWKEDVYLRQAAQEAALAHYGPAEEKGFVRIPIQRAIEAVAGKLPVKPASLPPQAGGLLDGGEPNSGRCYREKP